VTSTWNVVPDRQSKTLNPDTHMQKSTKIWAEIVHLASLFNKSFDFFNIACSNQRVLHSQTHLTNDIEHTVKKIFLNIKWYIKQKHFTIERLFQYYHLKKMFVIKTYPNICKCMQNSADFPSNSEQKKNVYANTLLVCKLNLTQTFGLSVKGF